MEYNQFDELVLDDKALEEIANFIVLYCNNQQVIINDYLQKMNSLSNEWRDDETIVVRHLLDKRDDEFLV